MQDRALFLQISDTAYRKWQFQWPLVIFTIMHLMHAS